MLQLVYNTLLNKVSMHHRIHMCEIYQLNDAVFALTLSLIKYFVNILHFWRFTFDEIRINLVFSITKTYLKLHSQFVDWHFKYIWIGYFDNLASGTSWNWIDGRGGYTNWATGQPRRLSSEPCSAFYTGNGMWDSASCTHSLHILCRRVSYNIFWSYILSELIDWLIELI